MAAVDVFWISGLFQGNIREMLVRFGFPEDLELQSHTPVYVKNPKPWQPYHCLDTNILHTLKRNGSAALAAVVPYSDKATRISHKGPMY